jgi:hypothetical protein
MYISHTGSEGSDVIRYSSHTESKVWLGEIKDISSPHRLLEVPTEKQELPEEKHFCAIRTMLCSQIGNAEVRHHRKLHHV